MNYRNSRSSFTTTNLLGTTPAVSEAVDALSKRGEVSRWDDAHCFGGECTKQLYYNVNDKCHWNKPNLIPPYFYDILLQWYFEYVEEYIPFAKIPHNDDLIYNHRGSAQFLVHRDLIRGLPKRFYERLYNWIITTTLDNYVTSRLLEYTWHIFWVIYPAINISAR